MRISDWSSDVCSSDLAHAHAAPMQFHHLALERVEEQLHQRADLFLRPAPVLAGEREQRERGDPAFEAEVDAQVDRARTGAVADHPRPPPPRRPSAVAVHDDGEVAGEGPRKVIPPRSEEHTSELQSIMRNSYAVFCLKKKKNMTIISLCIDLLESKVTILY